VIKPSVINVAGSFRFTTEKAEFVFDVNPDVALDFRKIESVERLRAILESIANVGYQQIVGDLDEVPTAANPTDAADSIRDNAEKRVNRWLDEAEKQNKQMMEQYEQQMREAEKKLEHAISANAQKK
jgi:isopentenyl diphosphate isomerase/L-lactate dehydrogenase-like FMN-dependent dehydrogenase